MNTCIARAVTTLAQMLADRGESDAKLASLSLADIDDLASSASQGIVRIDSGSRDVIFFVYKTKSGDLVRAASETADQRLSRAILVTIEPLKKTQKAAALTSFGPLHEQFTLAELALNISRHTLVPKHELIPKGDIPALKARLKLSSMTQLPLIASSDAMAKYIGMRPGDVVQVTRTCPTSGTQVAYRYCRS